MGEGLLLRSCRLVGISCRTLERMTGYNEADTRAKLIDPKLRLAGWGEGLIEREHYFDKGRKVTDGRIYLVGEKSRRREPRRVDYLLRYDGQMIALLEAKYEGHSPDAGLEQAKAYARHLEVPFAYSSNGHAFVEFDFLGNRSRELEDFPKPDYLWARWREAGLGVQAMAEQVLEEASGSWASVTGCAVLDRSIAK